MNNNKLPAVIYKYRLDFTRQLAPGVMEATLKLPYGFACLDVQVQDGAFTLWASIEPKNEERLVTRTIIAVFTGVPCQYFILTKGLHLKTIQAPDGLVYHLFDAVWTENF